MKFEIKRKERPHPDKKVKYPFALFPKILWWDNRKYFVWLEKYGMELHYDNVPYTTSSGWLVNSEWPLIPENEYGEKIEREFRIEMEAKKKKEKEWDDFMKWCSKMETVA